MALQTYQHVETKQFMRVEAATDPIAIADALANGFIPYVHPADLAAAAPMRLAWRSLRPSRLPM